MRQLDLFLSIGLDKKTAENALVNPKVTSNLTAVIKEAGVIDGCSKSVGNLLKTVADKFPANALQHRPTLLEYIVSLKIKSPAQLDAAFAFLKFGPEKFLLKDFEEACGVGVEVSLEEIEAVITAVLKENIAAILEQRYHFNVGMLVGEVRKKQPWADVQTVKEISWDTWREDCR